MAFGQAVRKVLIRLEILKTLAEKEVQEKLLPGEPGVSPRFFKVPKSMGD